MPKKSELGVQQVDPGKNSFEYLALTLDPEFCKGSSPLRWAVVFNRQNLLQQDSNWKRKTSS
jgi:hypothetical protein